MAGDLVSSVKASSARLGINPSDLLTAMSYETGGTLDPNLWGGKVRQVSRSDSVRARGAEEVWRDTGHEPRDRGSKFSTITTAIACRPLERTTSATTIDALRRKLTGLLYLASIPSTDLPQSARGRHGIDSGLFPPRQFIA
jgi:hypothetical protein